jgi:ELWxxDGT repeat protein
MISTRSRWPVHLLRTTLILGVALIARAATVQAPQLVRDINTLPVPASSWPSLLCDAPAFTLLVAEHSHEHYGLWRTDGTQAGTVEIKQIPMPPGSSTFSCLYAEGPGPAFFQFSGDAGTPHLWRSDGTTAGTFRLLQQPNGAGEIQLLGMLGGGALLAANWGGSAGLELIRSDGTVAGTQLLKDLTPGAGSSHFGQSAVILNGQLLFIANGDLWSTDGTSSGTHVVLDLAPSASWVGYADIVPLGNRVVFSRVNDVGDSEIWVSDGTPAGSSRLAAFSVPPGSPVISALTAVSATRAVFAVPSAGGPPYSPLWRTDGTVPGTQLLLPALPDMDFRDERMHAVAGGAVFMGVTDANGRELWFTDGTDAGTRLLRDHEPGPDDSTFNAFFPVPGGQLYFRDDQTHELWFSDGTLGGTWSVSALDPQLAADGLQLPAVSMGADILLWSYAGGGQGLADRRTMWRVSTANRSITRVQDIHPRDLYMVSALRSGRMLFTMDTNPYGAEPWISDGTAAGTRLLRNLEPEPVNGSSDPVLGFHIGGDVLFGADDGTQGRGLWRTDGTSAGTRRLAGGAPVNGINGMPYAQLGTSILYAGENAAGLPELWRTDGTSAGTVLVRDLSGPAAGSMTPQGSNPGSCGAGFVAGNGVVYYGASPGGIGKLFRTDGTTAGTVELGAFPPATVCVQAVSGGSVYFQAVDTANGAPLLWRSNGQVGGHQKVMTASGRPLFAPYNMIEMGGSLYFSTNAFGEWGIWRLTPGDPLARLVVPRTWSTDPSFDVMIAELGNKLLFREGHLVNGAMVFRMFRSDGTPAGTYALGSARGSGPQFGIRIGLHYMYTGPDGPTGFDLYYTDGTVPGTTAIHVATTGNQLYPSPEFVDFNGLTYFTVTKEVMPGGYVEEIWRSDGTSAGTERVNQLPSIDRGLGFGPRFLATGHRLLFASRSEAESRELWAMENEAPVAQPDSATTTAPNGVTIDVLANDSDPDGTLTRGYLRIETQPANGTVVVEGVNRTARYTPAAGFTGVDTFRYVAADTQGRGSASVAVTVTVSAAPSGGGGGSGSGGGSSGGGGAANWLSLAALALLLGVNRRRAGI